MAVRPFEYLDPHAFDDKQLPREPFEAHKREDGTVSDKRKWMYHYNQCLFGSGTHYIILDTADDAFDFECLGTIGNVVAHGGTLAYRRLRSHILLGHPTVLLYNTGGATQAFGSLLRRWRGGWRRGRASCRRRTSYSVRLSS